MVKKVNVVVGSFLTQFIIVGMLFTYGILMTELEKEFDWVDLKGRSDVKEKEYYIDKQGRKIEKHTNYEYSQPLFSEKNP